MWYTVPLITVDMWMLTSHSSCFGGVSCWNIKLPEKCHSLNLKKPHPHYATNNINTNLMKFYPFPSLSLGAVVAVTTWTPSGHHSNWVESLAFENKTKHITPVLQSLQSYLWFTDQFKFLSVPEFLQRFSVVALFSSGPFNTVAQLPHPTPPAFNTSFLWRGNTNIDKVTKLSPTYYD